MGSKEVWTFLFISGALFFNWPFLSIFKVSLPYYLFGAWVPGAWSDPGARALFSI